MSSLPAACSWLSLRSTHILLQRLSIYFERLAALQTDTPFSNLTTPPSPSPLHHNHLSLPPSHPPSLLNPHLYPRSLPCQHSSSSPSFPPSSWRIPAICSKTVRKLNTLVYSCWGGKERHCKSSRGRNMQGRKGGGWRKFSKYTCQRDCGKPIIACMVMN